MKTKKVVGKIFDAINYSKKLKISSILPDRHNGIIHHDGHGKYQSE